MSAKNGWRWSSGDASGHGISSGLLMALAKGALFNQLGISPDPLPVMQTLNRLVYENGPRRNLMTFCYTLLGVPTGRITIANAGHPYPMLYCAATKTVHGLEEGAYPLGVRPTLGNFPVLLHSLNPQDIFVLYSDGIQNSKTRPEATSAMPDWKPSSAVCLPAGV